MNVARVCDVHVIIVNVISSARAFALYAASRYTSEVRGVNWCMWPSHDLIWHASARVHVLI